MTDIFSTGIRQEPADETDAVKPSIPVGVLRQLSVMILGEDTTGDGMTIQAIERYIGQKNPVSTRDVVEQAIDGLMQEKLVRRNPKDTRRLVLSKEGEKFAAGLRALAAG